MTPRLCRVDTHGPVNVFQPLLAQIGELDLDLASNLIVRRRRNADTSRLSNALKPRGDVDTVPEDVVALDQDVSKVDPDPEQHTPVLRDAFISLSHHRLHSYCAFDRIDRRVKLKQHAVPSGLDETDPEFGYDCICDRAVFTACACGTYLVEAH